MSRAPGRLYNLCRAQSPPQGRGDGIVLLIRVIVIQSAGCVQQRKKLFLLSFAQQAHDFVLHLPGCLFLILTKVL